VQAVPTGKNYFSIQMVIYFMKLLVKKKSGGFLCQTDSNDVYLNCKQKTNIRISQIRSLTCSLKEFITKLTKAGLNLSICNIIFLFFLL